MHKSSSPCHLDCCNCGFNAIVAHHRPAELTDADQAVFAFAIGALHRDRQFKPFKAPDTPLIIMK